MSNLVHQILHKRYRVIRQLGEGAAGAVWLVEDLWPPRQRLAIKLLQEQVAPELNAHQRLILEGQIKLRHPNIVGVLDSFEDPGMFGVVMEYVEGESLADRLQRDGKFEVDEAVRIIKGVLAALDFAHQSRIIHRDVKASNVLLDRAGTPRLCDFGIARRIGGRHLTRAGLAVGTPHYMSPEQFTARHAGELDHRTDVYSAGVLFFELLTGHLPFESSNDYDLMRQHLEQEPPDPRVYVPEIPEGYVAVIARALRKNRDRRIGACSDMLHAIEQAELGEGEVAVDIELDATPVDRHSRAVHVFRHPTGATETVKAGFSWPAMFFSVAWLFHHHLVDKALYWCSAMALVSVALLWALETKEPMRPAAVSVALLAWWVVYLLPAFLGSRWREDRLKQEGYGGPLPTATTGRSA